MGKPRDKFWDYADIIPNEGKRWECKFCNKIYSGGASRIKAHLAKVECEGIKVCEAVDEATTKAAKEALEALDSNKRPRQRRRLDSGPRSTPMNPQVADLQSTLPFPSQSNLNEQMQRSPDPNERIWRPCSSFVSEEVDRSGWRVRSTSQQEDLPPLTEGQCSSFMRELLTSPVLLPENVQPSLPESTRNVQPLDVNYCGDNPAQDEPDLAVEDCEANNIMPEQTNHSSASNSFPRIDPDLNNEDNGDNASVLHSSASNSFPREDTRPGMLAPKLVGRERIVDELWGYLMKNDILRIGVYGMGGVGKTTTMKHLYNKVRDSAAFENVFWVTVSKDCSIHELQNKIARALVVPELFKDVDEGMRPTVLFNHLSKEKKCLVILDDMWRHFKLADVGIPVKRDGVRLVLTTRYRDVCEKMCEEKIGVRPLSDEEAWALFVQTLGSDLPPSRQLVAEDIVKECKGLPLAIVVMAGSMKGEVEDHVWEATLENLKRPGVLQQSMKEDVFPILVHSYNRLDEKKQLCFSLCALYPEDWPISREELIELSIDEGVIREDRRWKMYNEGHRLLDELEKACLLEKCPVEEYDEGRGGVRMHDVIRDMALHIMNGNSAPCMVKSGLGLEEVPDDEDWLPNLQKVSLMSNDIEAVPPSTSPDCPKLATLLLRDCDILHKISKRFFRRMQGLKVIDLRFTGITKVPKSVMNLKKLRALILEGCSQLSRIPSLAKLTSLRKLDLRWCEGIKEVPDGLGMLVNLTYLDLSGTGIERIPDGVVRKLKKLQHLKAENIAVKGEVVGKLRKLEVLRCRLENVNELNEHTRHATTIESYILFIGDWTEYSVDNGYWDGLFDSGKAVIMDDVEIRETCHFPRDVKLLRILHVRTWKNISSFTGLEELEVLGIDEGDEVSSLGGSFPSLAKLISLRELDLRDCISIKEAPDGLGMLVNLTYLDLRGTGIKRIPGGVVCKLKKLQHLRADYIAVKGEEVGKLRKLEVLRCRFENVNELNEYTRHATTIESYHIDVGGHHPNSHYSPDSGKAVIMDDLEIRETCHFPRDVKRLWILRAGTWKNISSFTGLEELENLSIRDCDEVSALGGSGGQPEEPEGQLEERTSPPPLGDLCPNLKALQISGCPKLKHLLVPRRSCNLYLKKLERLHIEDCEELESIIGAATDEEESLTSSTSPLPPDAFSQLQSIKIVNCPKMKRVLTLESFMLLSNLEKLEIVCCEELESIIDEEESLTSSTSPLPPDAFSQLQSIYIYKCPKMKRVLTLELFMLLPNFQTIIVKYCKEMKEVIGGQELDRGATSSLFLPPIPAASPGDQLSTRKLTLELRDLQELESICSWTGLRDLIHFIEISRCPKLKRIEMLDNASPPPSLKEIVLGGDYEHIDTQWWESLEWVHPEAKTALEPYVFVRTLDKGKIPLRECRSLSVEGLGRDGWTQTVLKGSNDTRQGGGFIQGGTMGSNGLHHEIPH